jgi:hypothetical protein
MVFSTQNTLKNESLEHTFHQVSTYSLRFSKSTPVQSGAPYIPPQDSLCCRALSPSKVVLIDSIRIGNLILNQVFVIRYRKSFNKFSTIHHQLSAALPWPSSSPPFHLLHLIQSLLLLKELSPFFVICRHTLLPESPFSRLVQPQWIITRLNLSTKRVFSMRIAIHVLSTQDLDLLILGTRHWCQCRMSYGAHGPSDWLREGVDQRANGGQDCSEAFSGLVKNGSGRIYLSLSLVHHE